MTVAPFDESLPSPGAAEDAASSGAPSSGATSSGVEWARAEHAAVATRALLALRPYASPGRARFDLPGPASSSGRDSDALEAFARSFAGAAHLLAGQPDDPHGFAEWYAAGITAGVDPHSPERWPTLDERGQAQVEAAALAVALHQTRVLVWERLSPRTQQQLVAWLQASSGVAYPPCNWVLFHTVTQAFLGSVGAANDEARVAEHLEFMTGCHVGDGWYSDAPLAPHTRPRIDWYNSWVIHHLFFWQTRMAPDEPTTARLSGLWRQRLGDWAERAVRLIADDGAPLFQGRSLTYRFGVVAGLWDAAIAGVGPRPELVRRAAGRTVAHFVDHGAFDDLGLLTLGWHGTHERMRQPYSGPGSPYWAMHGFAGLALPADHPIWTSEAPDSTPAPAPGPALVPMPVPAAGWLIDARAPGLVTVANHGVDHASDEGTSDPLYDRLAFSTATAPIETDDPDALRDNTVIVEDEFGRWQQRLLVTGEIETAGDAVVARSTWRCGPGPKAPVVSARSVPADEPGAELRDISVDRACRLTVTGWPVATGSGVHASIEPVDRQDGERVRQVFRDQPLGDEVVVEGLRFEVAADERITVRVTCTRD
ncbi:DUF2264 domain-containing protein [Aestuariimicrobium soli]|uniref:DUF2264 domain-containing protein n=1 Tax=Aestuariimicrobium soli TaxID=2035834 RepID=UPI003EBF3AD3